MATASRSGEDCDALQASVDPKLRVTVVCTTLDGTVAALRAAAALAKHLGAQIALVAPEVVPIRLPLDRPQISVQFLERRYCDLVASADVTDQPVTIRIWLCRDREQSLKQALAPHSLIVIGGSTRWWRRRERKMAQWLRTLGHHVVFVNAAAKESIEPQTDGSRPAACHRVLEKEARGVDR
ncbi:MAG: hypothetical protein WBF35_04910 [Candidatus Acidiferrales bacterium]